MDTQQLTESLRRIRLFACDVDGVLTDAGMYYSERGDELKKFNTRDGNGIGRLQVAGIVVAFITGETTAIVERRAAKLKVEHLFQGVTDKARVLRHLQDRLGIAPEETAYVGDDWNDLGVRDAVGVLFAVNDACQELCQIADFILLRKGGEGAVREAADMILAARK
jgi:YrbI family 3-deoxy-D-manno-octulosonate 8-phosphate phosphatase